MFFSNLNWPSDLAGVGLILTGVGLILTGRENVRSSCIAKVISQLYGHAP